MRQITLADLDRLPFSLHHVAAVDMVPRKPTFVSLPGGRPASCLFYIVSGACSFSWAGGEIRMEPGCLGYLPRGSVHLYRTLTSQIRYIRLDFQLQSPEDGEHLILSPHPLVLLEETPAELCRVLVKDGLLSDPTYTQDLNQYRAVVNVTTQDDMIVGVAAAPYYMRFVTSSIYPTASEDFWILEPVEGVNGGRVAPTSAGNFLPNWAITSSCKDPVTAIKWLDGLCSREMNIYSSFGDEGEEKDWYFTGEYTENGAPVIKRVTSTLLRDGSSTQNRRWTAWGSRTFHGDYKSWALELDPMSLNQRQIDASATYAQYAVKDGKPAVIWCTDDDLQTRVKELQTLVTDYAKNMYSQFLLGTKDIYSDADWAEYQQGLKAAGVEEYCQLLAEYWYGAK